MKRATVFSLVREQSVFMTVIMALLNFLAVMSLGIALMIGTGVVRWNAQWDLYATVQVTNSANESKVQKILNENISKAFCDTLKLQWRVYAAEDIFFENSKKALSCLQRKRFALHSISVHADRTAGECNLSSMCFAVVFLQKNNQKNALSCLRSKCFMH